MVLFIRHVAPEITCLKKFLLQVPVESVIFFHCKDVSPGIQQVLCQGSQPRPDLEDPVSLFYACSSYDALKYFV